MRPTSAQAIDTVARLGGATVIAFLILPLFVILAVSLNDGNFFTLPRDGVSLRWYSKVLTDPEWGQAARNSLYVACFSTVIAVALGATAGCGVALLKGKTSAIGYGTLMLPLIMPSIIAALAIYISFNAWGLTDTRAGLIVAHAALGIPFVVVTTSASMRKYDTRLYIAALSLGAGRVEAVRHAVLPSLVPSLAAGAIYAFHASFDESIIVLLLAQPDQTTLPQRIFSGLTSSIAPDVAVVSVMTTFATIMLLCLFLIAERFQSKRIPSMS